MVLPFIGFLEIGTNEGADKFVGQSRPIRNMSPLPPAFFTLEGRKSQS